MATRSKIDPTPLPTADPRPIAFSYIRFSDYKQLLGDSMRRQLERSRSYAEKHNLRLDESTTIRDLGISAFRGANRTIGGFALFLQAIKDGKIPNGSYLLVESFDRISREPPLSAAQTFINIINAGVIIVTLIDEKVHSQRSINEDTMGLFASLVKFAQANEESAKKSDRLSQVWRRKQREQAQGIIATAKCPGWLRRDGNSFVVNEERAAVVRRIFADFISGIGRGSIARTLNREGIPPFGHGTEWHGGTVQKVTTNPAVIGRFQPHTVVRETVAGPDGKPMLREKRVPTGDVIQGYYPTIIEPEVFFRAQAVASDRSVVPGNTGGRKGTNFSNIFSGITRCVHCNRRMLYRDRGPRSSVVLLCSGSRNGMCENSTRYDYKGLESTILDWVQELNLGETQPVALAEAEERVAEFSAKQDDLIVRAGNLVDAIEGGSRLALERLRSIEDEIEAVRAQLVTARQRVDEARGAVPADERKAQIAALRARMSAATGSELYNLRASIAQSLREIVKVMVFLQFGTIQVVIKGGEKQYNIRTGRLPDPKRYTVTPYWMPTARADDEFSQEERKMLAWTFPDMAEDLFASRLDPQKIK